MRAGGELADFSDERENADKIFNASKGALALGATANTRFGVIAERTGNPAPTAQSLVDSPIDPTIQAFAYSPLDATPMTKLPTRAKHDTPAGHLPLNRTAMSSRHDHSAPGMGIERLEAEITNLTSTEDGSAWQHDPRIRHDDQFADDRARRLARRLRWQLRIRRRWPR